MRLPLTVTLVTLVLATMASGQTGPEQQQGDTHTIRAVQIAGNHRIPAKKIFAATATREGDRLDPAQIDRDVRRIYGLGHFKDVKAFLDDDYLLFEVVEWPLISGIAFEGISSDIVSMATAEWTKQGIEMKIDSEYLPEKAKRATSVIRDILEKRGYSDPKVEVVVENVSQTKVVVSFKAE
jgi:outer membrane protein insertion porin family